MLRYDIIGGLYFTEKTSFLKDSFRQVVVYSSSMSVTKNHIRKAFEGLFKDVKVKKVNSLSVLGKTKRFKGHLGKRNNYKKFIVVLQDDFDINNVEVR
ncbi:MAG: 50S ribosomal protein L23 [Candidatus Xenolissoclinum pacificiensis L6]|uniref:Large ribosomal subunit protein uL23 n=1 Tax=Candidatus Xenolissoclinum pacificiensis L6 TaxID=1401685 RepID=W2V0Z7_9RICK|nr:MAG: 50S ribosomal protein L23 [Candidatus Xenolissoclinum pacificiensis L6]